jgi:hypothetical protein
MPDLFPHNYNLKISLARFLLVQSLKRTPFIVFFSRRNNLVASSFRVVELFLNPRP